MKLSDLIRKLEILKAKHGDNDLYFNVIDSFDRYGKPAEMMLKVGDEGDINDWFGSNTIDNETRIKLYLRDQNGKKSKITFRKQ